MIKSPTQKKSNITDKISRLSISLAIVALGVFLGTLIYISLVGNNHTATSQLLDTTPPVINGAKDIKIYVGEAPAYRKNITLYDNGGKDVSLTVDSSAAIISEPGRYPIIYTATDAAGNIATKTVFLTVEVYYPDEKELNQALDKVITQIITPEMNTEEKIRAIYDYIQRNMIFTDDSDKTNWKAEAYRSLFVASGGDCFSFFAASKAFFERLGIENLDIKRPDELSLQMQQTHYWSMVNISDDPNQEVWYHFDSCRLRAEYNHSGCLLTEQQINAYNCVRENFYAYDSDKYPKTSDVIITPTPELEQFYSEN